MVSSKQLVLRWSITESPSFSNRNSRKHFPLVSTNTSLLCTFHIFSLSSEAPTFHLPLVDSGISSAEPLTKKNKNKKIQTTQKEKTVRSKPPQPDYSSFKEITLVNWLWEPAECITHSSRQYLLLLHFKWDFLHGCRLQF